MPYRLRENLSFCEIDGQIVFLDIDRDRYFQLPKSMKHVFAAFLDNGAREDIKIDRLVGQNILVEAPSAQHQRPSRPYNRPHHSALEQHPASPKMEMLVFVEVLAIVHMTCRHLRKRRFKTVIDDVVACREKRANPNAASHNPATGFDIINAAIQFNNARRYVPIETSCLLDSLSMLRFLSRRYLWANIAFGITLNPFSAHCWLQAGDVALNETVSDANVYTPIKMI